MIVKLFFAENSNATIELVDLQGNKISVLENETFLRAENQITLSNSYIKRLENGVYFLILRNGKILKTCKFIKY
ncbi:MAG: T9SS type A sorting domain-containing protein [Bacteroidota bacterium]